MTVELVLAVLLAGCVENRIASCREPVVVNEVLAGAHSATLDGEQVDWVELYNLASHAVGLEGWSLSRTPVEHEYEFPAGIELAPRGFLVVVTDTFQRPGLTVTGFDLNRDGDGLFLRGPLADDRALCDEVYYPDQHADFSWQRVPDGGDTWCDASTPTPGEPNTSPCIGGDTGASP